MNLDDRLEALARSTEANNRQLEVLLELVAKHDADIAKLATRHNGDFARLEKLVAEIAEGTARLLHTAELHEHRLDSHDDRLDNLESQ
jgi:chromosome segregation ATPase